MKGWKPCPFCGSDNILYSETVNNDECWCGIIKCYGCKTEVKIPIDNKGLYWDKWYEYMLNRWNTRVIESTSSGMGTVGRESRTIQIVGSTTCAERFE